MNPLEKDCKYTVPIFSENWERVQDVVAWQEKGLVDIARLSYEHSVRTIIGGDGTMLGGIRDHYEEGIPFFGINRGTVGFLLNPIYEVEQLIKAFRSLYFIDLKLIDVSFYLKGGTEIKAVAFNDVYFNVKPGSGCHGVIRGECYPEKRFSGDGIIITSPQGSTAYNKNAGGMTLPLGLPLLGLQTICAPRNVIICDAVREQELEVEFSRGDMVAHADNFEVESVERAVIHPSKKIVRLAFMEGYMFEKIRYQ